MMGEFVKDPNHWLLRYSPDEWIRAALGELTRARGAWERGDSRRGSIGLKRAAGMALNAALIVEPTHPWGRTYVEHIEGLAIDQGAPLAVRDACRRLLQDSPADLVPLRTPRGHEASVEAAHNVIAHAWAVVKRHEAV